MSLESFLLTYKWIILFYLVVILWLLWKRKKIATQAKIIFLYRTKIGMRLMDKIAAKRREWVKLIGYIGVGAAYIGLLVISIFLIANLVTIFTKPEAPSGVSLVLPGVNVPGLGVLPFWYWLIAIFIIAVVHEFSHGVVARAHNVPLQSTGIVFFGPIIGAFVEPDEKKMAKETDTTQYSILAAGSFSNLLLAIFAILLLTFALVPLQQTMVEPMGFSFGAYVEGSYPAAQAGLPLNTPIIGINNKTVADFFAFNKVTQCLAPGQQAAIATQEKDYALTLAAHPDDPERGFLGINDIKNEVQLKESYQTPFYQAIYATLLWLSGFFRWLFVLSLGIGLFNLLPLPLVDGGRMVQVTMHKLSGKEKGEKRYRKISLFFLLLLLLNLFLPLVV